MSNPILCIMGPTASGKSGLALELAKHAPIELINVDSALIYKGMDIGTAKPTTEEQAQVPHHLIDIRDPSESYSAGDFVTDALLAIQNIFSRDKTPVLVGGTMLYYKALQYGIAELPKADDAIRQNIEAQAQQHGWQALHHQLKIIDPESAARIHPNDPQRLQRALEVYELTGETMTALQNKTHVSHAYTFKNIAIIPEDRAELHAKIAQRFHAMLEQGFLDEVKALYQRGDLTHNLPSIRSVGYRQAWQYCAGEIDYDMMIKNAIVATRQLAKRQLTWLRHWPDLTAFPSAQLAFNILKNQP